jgi:hypothetical protein
MDPEWISALTGIGVGAGTAIIGLWTYSRNKKKERVTEIVMPLLEKYNHLDEAEIAIDILDDFGYRLYDRNDEAYDRYNGVIWKECLVELLRDHELHNTSDDEDEVRKSFDALLYFFAELEYIVRIGLIDKKDLVLFNYEIQKAASNEGVRNFVRTYRLPLYGILHKDLKSGNPPNFK